MRIIITGLLALLFFSQCSPKEDGAVVNQLKAKINRFAETEIKYDHSLLNDREKVVVQKLYEASKIIDQLFMEQVYAGNSALQNELMAGSSEELSLQKEYFYMMFGPFDRLNHDEPFIGTSSKPEGANFYPQDMTKAEFEKWLSDHAQDEPAFTSEFTVIRRDKSGNLTAIPYSDYYREYLQKISALLREAAEYADNASLKTYLLSRATAFETNDYFQSDMDWMDLRDHRIEVIIGPYEVYEDGLFNYKASFESFVTLIDPEETKKLETFGSYLNDIEANLPIPEKYKNFERGAESPIIVAQEVFSAGDTKAGVQTLAFNLPNDERVRQVKGSKKVMLKNIHEAKFEKLLKPIAETVLPAGQLSLVTFNAFFSHTLMHEMSHGVGPGFITIDGRDTEVKKELKETYSIIEECKADVLGLYNNQLMISKGVYPAGFENEMWVTFLAGIFRSVRFGITEAHGGGNAIIYNYLLEKGAFVYDSASGKVHVEFDKITEAVRSLAHDLLTLQAEGNYSGAKEFISRYAVESESMKYIVTKLGHLAVDIRPVFQIEQENAK